VTRPGLRSGEVDLRMQAKADLALVVRAHTILNNQIGDKEGIEVHYACRRGDAGIAWH
jgi:hypothetical protein